MIIAAIIGFLFGFMGSMPVAGPIAVLVFARGIENRFRSGIAIATGGAIAEGIYACLAFWGFAKLLQEYTFVLPFSKIVAAIILFTLGIIFWRTKEVKKQENEVQDSALGGFFLGFTITALNPTLIATWSAAATTLFSTGLIKLDTSFALPFGGAAIAGIISWFSLLLFLVYRFRDRFNEKTLTKIIRGMGVFVFAIGLYFLYQFIILLPKLLS